MSKGHVIISRWMITIIVSIILAIIPMTIGIIYNQGKQSQTIQYIAESVSQIKDIVRRLADQDIALAKHDTRLNNLERIIYGKATSQTEKGN